MANLCPPLSGPKHVILIQPSLSSLQQTPRDCPGGRAASPRMEREAREGSGISAACRDPAWKNTPVVLGFPPGL